MGAFGKPGARSGAGIPLLCIGSGNEMEKAKPPQWLIACSPGTVAEDAIADAADKKPLTSIKIIQNGEKYIFFCFFGSGELNFPPEQQTSPGKARAETGEKHQVFLVKCFRFKGF